MCHCKRLIQPQRACIYEGLRVNAVPTARNVRVATNETLHCGNWAIEPGVSLKSGMTRLAIC